MQPYREHKSQSLQVKVHTIICGFYVKDVVGAGSLQRMRVIQIWKMHEMLFLNSHGVQIRLSAIHKQTTTIR